MKKFLFFAFTFLICSPATDLLADHGGLKAHTSNGTSLSHTALQVLVGVGLGSVFYTYLKTPQEVVPDHNNVLLNFFDNTWFGNREKEYGSTIDGNRVRPYTIPARGVVGIGMKYFWPAVSLAAMVGVWYGASWLAPIFLSAADGVADKAAHAITPSIPLPKGARIVRMDG